MNFLLTETSPSVPSRPTRSQSTPPRVTPWPSHRSSSAPPRHNCSRSITLQTSTKSQKRGSTSTPSPHSKRRCLHPTSPCLKRTSESSTSDTHRASKSKTSDTHCGSKNTLHASKGKTSDTHCGSKNTLHASKSKTSDTHRGSKSTTSDHCVLKGMVTSDSTSSGKAVDTDHAPEATTSDTLHAAQGETSVSNGLFCKCYSRCTAQKSCPCKKNSALCTEKCHPGHRCTNVETKKSIPIDVDKLQITKRSLKTPSPWCEIAGIRLDSNHKKILESSGWLDDAIITVSQNLLKAQHPAVGSLQPPILATKLAMEPQTGLFVQILNMEENHWLAVSTFRCKPGHINVYDSLHMTLSTHTKKVIADLMQHRGDAITISHHDVQWQSGSSDCGLFAVAFATAICVGCDPAASVFNQASMRQHLLKCFHNQRISPFPLRSQKRVIKEPTLEKLPIFCICRLPDCGDMMVQCDKCKEWYHPQCVKIPKKYLKRECQENYYCRYC